MSEKKLSKELIEALQKCKTKEEVEKFAKDNQLTDEELEKVVGGWGVASGHALQWGSVGANGKQEKDWIIKQPNS